MEKIGRYQITGVLGSGAMATVYKGHDPEIDRTIAIKVLKPEDAVIGSLEFASLDKAEFRSGWRIDVRGSGQEFLVELDAGAA